MINDAGKQPVNARLSAFPFWKAFRSKLVSRRNGTPVPIIPGRALWMVARPDGKPVSTFPGRASLLPPPERGRVGEGVALSATQRLTPTRRLRVDLPLAGG